MTHADIDRTTDRLVAELKQIAAEMAQPVCPCCHRPLGRALTASELPFLARPTSGYVIGPVLDLLAAAWPRAIPAAALLEHVYAGRPNGEPDSASKCIQVTIGRLRRQLAPYGWTISDGRLGGYRLERVAG
jgi:hypothetical protein